MPSRQTKRKAAKKTAVEPPAKKAKVEPVVATALPPQQQPDSVFIGLNPMNLLQKVPSEEAARAVFESVGMIPARDGERPKCEECGRPMGTVTRARGLMGWLYRCSGCRCEMRATKNTWFENSKLSFLEHLKILLLHVSGFPHKLIMKCAHVYSEAITQWTT